MPMSENNCHREIFLGPPLLIEGILFMPIAEVYVCGCQLGKYLAINGHVHLVAILQLGRYENRVWEFAAVNLPWDQLISHRWAWEARVHGSNTSGLG